MASCSCIYVDTDGDAPACFQERDCRARKTHVCTECGRAIQRGEVYESVCGKWDGDWLAYKTCAVCCELRVAFFCGGWHYACVIGDLYVHLREHDGAVPADCIAGLSAPARERLFEMIEQIWAELNDDEEADTEAAAK